MEWPPNHAQENREAALRFHPTKLHSLAHSFWEARGRTGGSAVEDWLRAERELRGLPREMFGGEG